MSGLKRNLIKFIYGVMRLFPVNQNRVLVFSYYGEQYSGSPKYISRYLQENSDLDIVWAFTDPLKHKNHDHKLVRYGRLAYYWNLATAGAVITNYRMTEEYQKRKGQIYIQTWHSSLRLKMIEKDAEDTLPAHYVEMAKKDSKQIDYLLAGSKKSREIFERSFWYNGEIVDCGTPQCDLFFDEPEKYRKKVLQYYGLSEESHIALYAPTFRKNHDMSVYDIDTAEILKSLQEKFGGNWYLLMRLHPHLINKMGDLTYTDTVIQATNYDDVQELLCAGDVLISDYSAIMFDYAVTGKPCFLYTPDLHDYVANDRNLYFDITQLPFRHALTQAELLENIQNHSLEDYQGELSAFMQKIGSYDDGHASKRVLDLIKEHIS